MFCFVVYALWVYSCWDMLLEAVWTVVQLSSIQLFATCRIILSLLVWSCYGHLSINIDCFVCFSANYFLVVFPSLDVTLVGFSFWIFWIFFSFWIFWIFFFYLDFLDFFFFSFWIFSFFFFLDFLDFFLFFCKGRNRSVLQGACCDVSLCCLRSVGLQLLGRAVRSCLDCRPALFHSAFRHL